MFALVLRDEQRQNREHCCPTMTQQINLTSALGVGPLEGSTDQRVYWSPVFDEYGLICQPSMEILLIQFCPFCGTKLPPSRRNAWHEALRKTGWQSWGDPIPPRLLEIDWQKL